MKLSELTAAATQRAIDEFYATVSGHVADAVHAVSFARYSIPRERRRIGPREFPYHLASDIDLVFRFALGHAEASPGHIRGLCDRLLDVLHTAPAGRVREDWIALRQTPLGVAILAARARVLLRDDEEALTPAEVTLLSGIGKRKLSSAEITPMAGRYPAPAVRELFEKEGVPI